MLNWSYERIRIKAHSWQTLKKNWISAAFLIMLTYITQMLGLNFMPIFTFKKMLTFSQVLERSFTELNQAEFKMLFDTLRNTFTNLWNVLFPAALSVNQTLLIIITVILLLMLTAPINIGLFRFFRQVSRGKRPAVWVALKDYTNMRAVASCISLQIQLGIRYIVWLILIYSIPAAVIATSLYIGSLSLCSVGALMSIIALILYYIKIGAYMCAGFILSEDTNIRAASAIRESVKLTRGKLANCAIYRLSFMAWKLLSAVFGYFMFIYQPFYLTTTASFVELLRGKNTEQETERELSSCQ